MLLAYLVCFSLTWPGYHHYRVLSLMVTTSVRAFYGHLYCKRWCSVKIMAWIDRLLNPTAVLLWLCKIKYPWWSLLSWLYNLYHTYYSNIVDYFHLNIDFLMKKRQEVIRLWPHLLHHLLHPWLNYTLLTL